MRHLETHRFHRIGWLRAAVLGANDGIVSTASLVLGVAAADLGRGSVLTAGVAGLVAGAMSMAAGEYVSVSSQKDTRDADMERERAELLANPQHEREELAMIYQARGVDEETARRVATQMMEHDALGAHARDELGISEVWTAQPLLAALVSATTFACGAALPLSVAVFAPQIAMMQAIALASLGSLVALGALAARAGGARAWVGSFRVGAWGLAAMAATTAIGRLFGTAT